MSSNNRKMRTKRLNCPSRDPQAHVVWQGYDDVRDGRGFCLQYDGWHEHGQRSYELGRSYAMAMRIKLGTIPVWKRNALLRPPTHEVSEIMLAEHAYHSSGRKFEKDAA